MVYELRTNFSHDHLGNLGDYLSKNKDFMKDFLKATMTYVPETDPRIRQCNGEETCIECEGNPRRLEGLTGYWPCHFHVHEGFYHEGIVKSECPPGVKLEEKDRYADSSCYLWRVIKSQAKFGAAE